MSEVGVNPATLLSITAVADLFGRIFCGLVIDSMDVPMHATYGGALLITAGSILALPAAQVAMLQTGGKNPSGRETDVLYVWPSNYLRNHLVLFTCKSGLNKIQ